MALSHVPSTMTGVILTGHGGLEKLQYCDDLKVPEPFPGEVLFKVTAAGINNTDISTRIGWYSKGVKTATDTEVAQGSTTRQDDDSTWSGVPLHFPRVQGADCCGRIVAVGEGVDSKRMGERILVRSMFRPDTTCRPFDCWTFGSECDGAFAQYTKALARETYKVDCDWTDVELGSVPCAYSTAENILYHSNVKDGERVLITGECTLVQLQVNSVSCSVGAIT
jgi:NADPH:quinone reductase-like Zn-dependent oxidoreductase